MLQLPLYVLAAAHLLGVDPSAGEAAHVYPTRRGDFRTVAWESGQLAQRHDDLLGLLGAMLEAMSRGEAVDRVTNLLASGRVRAEELVVITFTEKAAAELSTRVRDSLERRARSCDGEQRERLLRAARELYRAHIETIHSFAAALLLTSDEQPGGDWHELRPAPGRLTVVGDPKQSIYRFRCADIAVYDQTRHAALADGLQEISTSFRSNSQLLAGQAEVYADALGSATGLNVREVVFAYCRAGIEVRVKPDPSAR